MNSTKKELLIITLVALLSNVLIYLPFFLGLNSFLGVNLGDTGEDVLYRFWDGPLYVVVANYFYDTKADYSFYGLQPGYYAAHLPLYPAIIKLFSFIGSFPAMLLATTITFLGALYAFYFFFKEFFSKNAFLITITFIFLPFRWLVYHSIGATEPLFIALVLSSLYFYKKKNYLLAGILGGLASLTRIQGIFLFIAFIADYLYANRKKFVGDEIDFSFLKPVLPIAIIPLALTALFVFYHFNFGDFFAYFKVNAGFLQGFLSSVINYGGQQAGEEYLILFLAAAVTIALLLEKRLVAEGVFCALITLQVLFLSHNDISRYLLPVFPFTLMLSARLVDKKWFKLLLPFIALGGLIYVLSILPNNVMGIETYYALVRVLN